jgi:hypothetical protein
MRTLSNYKQSERFLFDLEKRRTLSAEHFDKVRQAEHRFHSSNQSS